MKKYNNTTVVIANAFSLSMIPEGDFTHTFSMDEVSLEDAREIIDDAKAIKSCVGHADTAKIFSDMLGTEVVPNRVSYSLDPSKRTFGPSEVLLVGQYSGPRLPEGATVLPEGARIRWFLIDFFWEYI